MIQKLVTNNNVVVFDQNDTQPLHPTVEAYNQLTLFTNIYSSSQDCRFVNLGFEITDWPQMLNIFKIENNRVKSIQLVVNEDSNPVYYWATDVQYFVFNNKHVVSFSVITNVDKNGWNNNYKNKCRVTKLVYEVVDN